MAAGVEVAMAVVVMVAVMEAAVSAVTRVAAVMVVEAEEVLQVASEGQGGQTLACRLRTSRCRTASAQVRASMCSPGR